MAALGTLSGKSGPNAWMPPSRWSGFVWAAARSEFGSSCWPSPTSGRPATRYGAVSHPRAVSRSQTASRRDLPDSSTASATVSLSCAGGYAEPGHARILEAVPRRAPGPTIPHARVMKAGEADPHKRVQNKLGLLEEMRSAGIWVVDAIVTALHRKGALAASRDNFLAVLRASWQSDIGEVVCQCAPSAVLIVGKGVEAAVGDVVRQDLGHGVEVAVGPPPGPPVMLSERIPASSRRWRSSSVPARGLPR
jgi:hypothetical protein